MTYLRNAWYCVAWSSEIGPTPFARVILDEPVLLYRGENGRVVAMSDRCPHRYAPLHRGTLHGEIIACPYHGLQFGPDGMCRHNPHGDGRVPDRQVLKVYPIVERQNVAWIWMGDPARADRSEAPDHPELEPDTGWTIITGKLIVRANFSLVVENLLDLTHAGYLHANSVSVDATLKTPAAECQVEADGVYSRFLTSDVPPPKPFAPYWSDPSCDYHRVCRWRAPSLIKTTIGVSAPGGPLADGVFVEGYHLLTPESATSTHYFWSMSRRFAPDDDRYGAALRELVEQAFMHEDEPMIASCQTYKDMGDQVALKPLVLSTDRPAVLAHRWLNRLIQERDAAA